MPWGRNAMSKVVSSKAIGSGLIAKHSAKLAKSIDKEDFLRQLKAAWVPYVKKHTPIEEELAAAAARIKSSPFAGAFESAGIEESDIRTVLEEIREGKIDPIRREEPKIGRNDPCPCGSGRKYKRCCLNRIEHT